ncbi:MAG TPA: efflux RND transporter periplasmic adaptor subunit [Verrucomicrobiae bacterium]|nr:efflux RND transporter periplasmic adaptor subunit [Verrucomicrobiae bacterium]
MVWLQRRRPLVIGGLALLAVLIAAAVAWHLRPVSGIEASGTLEAIESDVAPKVQGRLLELRVRDGERVRAGETVAVLERVDPTLNLSQAQANLVAAKAQVGVARAAYDLQRAEYATTLSQANSGVGIAGSHTGQAGENFEIERRSAVLSVDQAKAGLLSAQSGFARAKVDLGRARSLVATGDEPQQALDDASDAYSAAAAGLQSARDALGLAQAGLRTVHVRQLDVRASQLEQSQSDQTLESAQAQWQLVVQRRAQLAAADAAVGQAQAALGLAQDQVRETHLLAPFDGYVVSHNFEVGDLIAPGAAVMTIGDLDHPYLYVYVSETDLPHIKAGMRADATVDGFPNRTFTGTITELGEQAEFTPENVQTKEERVEYLVFRVKIQFTDTTGALKPGLPADAVIHT